MLKYFVAVLLITAAFIFTNGSAEMLPGSPKIVERNGHPYITGILQRYENGEPIYSYFNEETCKWLKEATEGATECEPLPIEEQTSTSKFQLKAYQPDVRGF